jgi:Amt family ammonium transporter
VLTALIGLAIKHTMGWRITPEAEVEGIDYDQHGESAYDWGTSSGSHVVGASSGSHVAGTSSGSPVVKEGAAP